MNVSPALSLARSSGRSACGYDIAQSHPSGFLPCLPLECWEQAGDGAADGLGAPLCLWDKTRVTLPRPQPSWCSCTSPLPPAHLKWVEERAGAPFLTSHNQGNRGTREFESRSLCPARPHDEFLAQMGLLPASFLEKGCPPGPPVSRDVEEGCSLLKHMHAQLTVKTVRCHTYLDRLLSHVGKSDFLFLSFTA